MIGRLLRAFVDGFNHPNVDRTDGGHRPSNGYCWLNEVPGDLRVVWTPGRPHREESLVATETEGVWRPADGYSWVDPDDGRCKAVRWAAGKPHPSAPHVRASPEMGSWQAAPGYRFVNRDPKDLRVEAVSSGSRDEGAVSQARRQRIRDLAVLGLSDDAPPGAIDVAFRRLAKLHHPDRCATAGAEAVAAATEAFRMVRAAYERVRV